MTKFAQRTATHEMIATGELSAATFGLMLADARDMGTTTVLDEQEQADRLVDTLRHFRGVSEAKARSITTPRTTGTQGLTINMATLDNLRERIRGRRYSMKTAIGEA